MTMAARRLEQAAERTEQNPDSVIEKVRCLVETLAEFGPLGLTALSRESGISKTTAHRLCGELVDWGVVERRAGAFALGARLSELGRMAPANSSLTRIAHPYLAELFARFRYATVLSVLQNRTSVRCVDKICAVGEDPSSWMDVGTRAPAYCTSAGKAIVAFSPREVFDAVVAEPLVAMTPYTISGPDRLAREMAEIRRTGVAWMRHEIRMNCVAVAVPVIDASGAVLGAVSCSVSSTMTRADELEQAMKVQARRIAQQMRGGAHGGGTRSGGADGRSADGRSADRRTPDAHTHQGDSSWTGPFSLSSAPASPARGPRRPYAPGVSTAASR
ncbi:hypothetical protein FRACA_1150014 [Frankia canadensis]|uniref:IclR family transcriptional regulator n=1 Tax=Frankia canadensis TaxID=1836972 RepID=A0A2I2KJM5_9ACTN|nr:IclR family transcriptional regulator [Frankia canadensis]SNQ45860.1 hypothetical protein FRACA_1150014 [Frankia canadensis]SOU53150.1 hypothetical protein FRACA_1150014 [Frankia canadensis]